MNLDWDTEEEPICLLLDETKEGFLSFKQNRIDEYCNGNPFEYQKV